MEWPDKWRRRSEILQNMERYLDAGEDRRSIVSFRMADAANDGPVPAPSKELEALLSLLERSIYGFHDLDAEISDEDAASLWDGFCRRAAELGTAGQIDRLSAWQLLQLIAVVVASGMSYSRLTFPIDDQKRRGRWASMREGFELYAVSVLQIVSKDLRRLPWLAAQPLAQGGIRGLCRHYTAIVQVLFYAAKRATGRWSDARVLSVAGTPRFNSRFDHAWNWFVEPGRPIVAFDLTGADWLLDKGEADSIFNKGFDGARWNNASAFLSTVFMGFESGSALESREEVVKALPELIDPRTMRGQALLYHLILHRRLHPLAEERVCRLLRTRDFDRLFPGWRVGLRVGGLLARAQRSPTPGPSMTLLDAIGN